MLTNTPFTQDNSRAIPSRTRSFGRQLSLTTSTDKTVTETEPRRHPPSEISSTPRKTFSQGRQSSTSHSTPSSLVTSVTFSKSSSQNFTSEPHQPQPQTPKGPQTSSAPSPCPSSQASTDDLLHHLFKPVPDLLGHGQSNPVCASSKPVHSIQPVTHTTTDQKTVTTNLLSSSEISTSKKTPLQSSTSQNTSSRVSAPAHSSSASRTKPSFPTPSSRASAPVHSSSTLRTKPPSPTSTSGHSEHSSTLTQPPGSKKTFKPSPFTSSTTKDPISTRETIQAGPKPTAPITRPHPDDTPSFNRLASSPVTSSQSTVNTLAITSTPQGSPSHPEGTMISSTPSTSPITTAVSGLSSSTSATSTTHTKPFKNSSYRAASPSSHAHGESNVGAIIGGSIAGAISVLLLVCVFLAFYFCRRKLRRELKELKHFKPVGSMSQTSYTPVGPVPFYDHDGSLVGFVQTHRGQTSLSGGYDVPPAVYPFRVQASRRPPMAENYASPPLGDSASTTTYHTTGSAATGHYQGPRPLTPDLFHTNESKAWLNGFESPGDSHHAADAITDVIAPEGPRRSYGTQVGIAI